MPNETLPHPVPRHIAIVMDGNGRWAKQRKKPRSFGHQAGVKAARQAVRSCVEFGVEALTLFAFSSENWGRPQSEVGLLMDLFLRALKSELEELHSNGVRMRFIGDISAFSDKLREQMRYAESLTHDNATLNLNIAVNYGGRWDITNAVREIAKQVELGQLAADAIDQDVLARHVSLADLPDPDLMIRTSGAVRISNYLLWQMAYTELYFCDTHWPDFDRAEMLRAIDWFSRCERRYGKTGEQVTEVGHA